MKTLRIPLLTTITALGLLLSASTTQAIDCPEGAACTDPVGFVTLTADPSDDGVTKKLSLLGLGLFNAIEFQGPVDTVNGTVLGVSGIAASQFDEFYFVQIASGDNSGIMVDIVSTASDSITLAQDISPLIAINDIIKIRKHHTVDSVFGANNEFGLLGSFFITTSDTIQFFDAQGSTTIFFQDFGSFGFWTDGGDPVGDMIIYPDQGFVIRRIGTSVASTKLLGSAKTDATAITIENGFNIISNVFPVDTTLGNSGLNTQDGGESGLLASFFITTADNVRIFDDQGILQTYFLQFESANYWTRGNDDATNVIIKEGSSFLVIRRGDSFNWFQPPTF